MHPEALSPHSTCRAFRSASPLLFPVRPSPVDPPQRLIQRVYLVHLVNPPHGPVAVNPHRPPMTVRAQSDRREVPALFDVVRLHDPARTADRTARFLHPSHVGRLGAGDCLGVFRSHAAISLGSNPRASQTFSHHCTGFVCVGSYSHGWSPIANASVIASVHWAFVKSRLDPPSITKPGAPSPRSIPGSSRQPKIVPAMKCLQSSLLNRNPCHFMQRDRSPHAALNRRRWSSLSISCQVSVMRSTSPGLRVLHPAAGDVEILGFALDADKAPPSVDAGHAR